MTGKTKGGGRWRETCSRRGGGGEARRRHGGQGQAAAATRGSGRGGRKARDRRLEAAAAMQDARAVRAARGSGGGSRRRRRMWRFCASWLEARLVCVSKRRRGCAHMCKLARQRILWRARVGMHHRITEFYGAPRLGCATELFGFCVQPF